MFNYENETLDAILSLGDQEMDATFVTIQRQLRRSRAISSIALSRTLDRLVSCGKLSRQAAVGGPDTYLVVPTPVTE